MSESGIKLKVTPAMAQAWLDQRDPGNRTISKIVVERTSAKITLVPGAAQAQEAQQSFEEAQA